MICLFLGVTDLIILPNTEEITDIKLTVTKQIYLNRTFVCQNVALLNKVVNQDSFHYPLRVDG